MCTTKKHDSIALFLAKFIGILQGIIRALAFFLLHVATNTSCKSLTDLHQGVVVWSVWYTTSGTTGRKHVLTKPATDICF